MYEFHYNYIKWKYPGDRSKLLFTDKDSLTYSFQMGTLYEDRYRDKHLFDLFGVWQGRSQCERGEQESDRENEKWNGCC